MPQPPDWNKYLDAGAEFVAMTRTQARKRAKELVGQGQLAQEQVQGFVDDLVDESRKRTDVLLDVVRKEIQRQVKTLGIATKEDLARLETKLAKQGPAKKSSKSSAKKKATTKSSSSKSASKSGSSKKTAKRATKKAASKAAAS
jgi:polyhydroxyalkanoate synthesis regulator phasin